MNRTSLETANSSHTRCFVCNRRNVRLHEVSRASMIQAYSSFRMLIKHHSRCCRRHLDEDGNIKQEEFLIIPTNTVFYDRSTIMLLDSFSRINSQQSGIFDQFKHADFLPNEQFVSITGWSKSDFMRFCRYISCINDSVGRTKEQLIAIYRFWLRKGTDQASLAMFKNSTSQQQISHYLKQIRKAINKDFVPYFLGARSKTRDFFLSHNNISVKTLYKLEADNLVIAADATYTRIEKSSNNSFQNGSYSMQKNDSLIKPFIVCCADGYFIDCYGPFKAIHNDATIFKYILDTDMDLKNILIPFKTTILLDRGKITCFFYTLNECSILITYISLFLSRFP